MLGSGGGTRLEPRTEVSSIQRFAEHREVTMRVFLVLLIAGLLAVSPTLVLAQQPKAPDASMGAAKQVTGAVKSVDQAKKTVTLDDGTSLMVSDEAKLKELKPGTMIKASYSEKGGQKVANSIEVMKK
jgi:Cu/Ag efflux protein CusF